MEQQEETELSLNQSQDSKTTDDAETALCEKFEKDEEQKDQGDGKELVEKEISPEEPPIPLVLEPDHPMMERFQAALKTHLLKQLERLSNQVFEMENEIKSKENEKEETGVILYAMQQEVYKQQKTLEDCDDALESLMKERQSLDESVRSKKLTWKEEMNCLNTLKKKEHEIKAQALNLATLQQQMEKWEKEMESELAVTQRMSEKTQYDKLKMVEEKRKMDMYLLKLMTAVSNSESEIRLLEAEITVKTEEKDVLNQTLADANADLQCLVTEQKRLTAAWNSVVSMISQKNDIYINIYKELERCQEGFRSLNNEIEGYKHASAEEMKKGERLGIIYGRLQNSIENCNLTLKNLTEKKTLTENKITSVVGMINRAEVELQHTRIAKEKYQSQINVINKEIDKLSADKRKAEDDAMNYLQEQVSNDKTATYLNRLLKEARERTRKQEFTLLEIENKISQKFLVIEEHKEVISKNNEIIKDINNKLKKKETELITLKEESIKNQNAVIQKQGNYASLVRKVEKTIEKCGYGKLYSSPLQLRIIELEKSNTEIQAKNDKMQSFWLLQQHNNMKLTHQRSKQLKDISLLRKQVLLLEQKALKTDLEFEKEKKIAHNLDKSILRLQHKIVVLNEILIGKKDYEENLGKENMWSQAQYLQNLKDAELKQIRLKAEIKELETNLEELAEVMLGVQREMLAWEKKVQSAIETKNDMQKERSGSGEIGQMKAEIHRMEVRYSQLKKAQEKLVTDLEQCVLRRDYICEGADAMEKRNTQASTRFNIEKKIETLKNSIRTVCNEQKSVQKLIDNVKEGHKELKNSIKEKEAQLVQMNETTKKMDLQLDEGKLNKIQNFEMLVRRQKKCKLYELVKNRKHRLLYKSEEDLDKQLQKLKITNNDLINVTEALIENFPAYHFQLRKIINTLKAKPS